MKRAISVEGNIIGQMTLFNDKGELRWRVNLIQHDEGYWAIEEDTQYSLFPQPLTTAPDLGTCLNWFANNEKELLAQL